MMQMFDSDLWTTDRPTPENTDHQMFIWAYREEGRWKTGLGYWTITKGQWRDAYDWNGSAQERATHFHPMPSPPKR